MEIFLRVNSNQIHFLLKRILLYLKLLNYRGKRYCEWTISIQSTYDYIMNYTKQQTYKDTTELKYQCFKH